MTCRYCERDLPDNTSHAMLCVNCEILLEGDLREATSLLLHVAQHGVAKDALAGYKSGYVTVTPIDVDQVSLLDPRSGITRTLRDWALLIADERDLTTNYATMKFAQMQNAHIGWIPWTVKHFDMAGDYLAEIHGELNKLRRAVHGKTHHVRVGHCPVINPDTGRECGKVLKADPDTDTIRCPKCRTEWKAEKNWRLLGASLTA